MRHLPCLAVLPLSLLVAVPAAAAVDLEQSANPHDRSFERLPDLRLVRGATPKTIALTVTAEAAEAWTITKTGDWLEVSPAAGTGPATVMVRFDGDALALLDDPAGSVTITGATEPLTNTETLAVNLAIWPSLSTASTPAELRAYAADPANWPQDGFDDEWQWWGFMPSDTSHPNVPNVGDNQEPWERTPCPPGAPSDSCTREGQAGLAAGMSMDTAWLLSTGDPRVVIAVLDSGVRWSERSLVRKMYMNASELTACPPPGADTAATDPFDGFDVNEDGQFTIRDYDDADWIVDVNGNGLKDAQDVIYADDGDGPCSDGIDDDGNGYTDDISGWDFFWNDNDASDDTDFGHGTGEANDSGGEVNDGEGAVGGCPRCLSLPVRVGDSFVVDVNQFADGVIFSVESGASLVQEALGSLNNTPYAQAAIDWAYQNNVPIVASAADETSYHHNYPGSLEHTLYVHAIVADTDGDWETAATFLNFGNCTNFGGHLTLSTPGTGCSSEATGNTSGHVGLFMSYYLQLKDASVGGENAAYYANPLTAEEVYQTLVTTADDIDVPGAEKDPEALAAKKFPSNEGWDLHFGYGRNNGRRSLEALRDMQIPPETDVSEPRWFQVFDPERTASFDVRATVKSARLTNLRWELFVSEGVVGKNFVPVADGTGTVDNDVLASVSFSRSGPLGSLVKRAADTAGSDPHQFSATLELRTVGTNPNGEDVRGVFRKTFGVRHDPTTLPGFPIHLGASGESSPKLTDLNGDGKEEIVVGTADGRLHAIGEDAKELAGFPVALGQYPALSDAVCGPNDDASPKCHRRSRPFATGAIDPEQVRTSLIASIAVGDLNGDKSKCRDIVAASVDGFVFAVSCEGEMLDGFPVEIDRTTLADNVGARRCENANGDELIGCRSDQQFGESGFFSSPALADMDGDGSLEIVIGGLDSWAYAWHGNGEIVSGWPVHLEHPDIEEFEADGDVRRFEDRIISSPAIADLFGDGSKLAFFGTNERVEGQTAVFLYGVWGDGNNHDGGPFPPGWPTQVIGFIPDEILPFVGRGNPNSPVAADVDDDGKDEIINAGMGGNMVIIQEDGTYSSQNIMQSTESYYGPNADVNETFSLPVINNPSVADVNGDGTLDIINGTAGSGLIQVASAGGQRAEFDHSVSVWDTEGGYFLDGFPHRVWDYQFFMNYAVADLEGTGTWNVISGDGGYFVYAPNASGKEADGFPKWTQGWHIGTPAVGDLDGDSRIDVVSNTREGDLWVWKTPGHVRGPASQTIPAIQWEGFHHDDQNTGNAGGLLKTYQPLDAPDDGESCGCAAADAPRTSPLAGLALVALAGTLLGRRRRR